MKTLLFAALSLFLFLNTASVQKSQKTRDAYRDVRGQIVQLSPAPKPGEQAVILLDHEAIPGFMEAMRMRLPLRRAADAKRFKTGDKIRFDLIVRGMSVANLRRLPPNTRLKLAR